MTEDRWAGTSWQIAEIDGRPVTGEATISFDGEGRVSGRAVVNRYFGSYVAEGGTVTLGPLGSTMMAGSSEAMAEEQLVLRALAGTLDVDAQVDGSVSLRGTSTMRLVPVAASEPGPTV